MWAAEVAIFVTAYGIAVLSAGIVVITKIYLFFQFSLAMDDFV